MLPRSKEEGSKNPAGKALNNFISTLLTVFIAPIACVSQDYDFDTVIPQ